jgi:hypothetical protein
MPDSQVRKVKFSVEEVDFCHHGLGEVGEAEATDSLRASLFLRGVECIRSAERKGG